MKDNIKILENLLEETTKFDFPIFANKEKKQAFLLEKKLYVENKLKEIAPKSFADREKIWNESVEHAEKQFKSLPAEKRLNGFYLQELMHCYAEKLGNNIMENE